MQKLQPSLELFTELLKKALEESISQKNTMGSRIGEQLFSNFFKNWYIQDGKSYFFLFKKNHKVTNIQYAELMSLIRTELRRNYRMKDIHFISTDQFRAWIEPFFAQDFRKDRDKIQEYANMYSAILRRTVIFDAYHTSCNIILPPTIKFNILAICSESGYIHSCGKTLFIRNIEKLAEEDSSNGDIIQRAIAEAVGTEASSAQTGHQKKIRFIPYSHEDFSGFDSQRKDYLQDGIEDVKLHVEKFYLGKKRLIDVLQQIRVNFPSIILANPGDYKEHNENMLSDGSVDRARTLWLIKDASIEHLKENIGRKQYLICYEQQFKNDNQFHLFDENKPAWIAHTTIPHTLLGAMINITRADWHSIDHAKILDPFAGTGSTYLEAIKYPFVECYCRDNEPIAQLLLEDNLNFFGKKSDELKALKEVIESIVELAKRDDNLESIPAIREALSVADLYMKDGNEFSLEGKPDGIARVRALGELGRIYMYIIIRSRVRAHSAIERGAISKAKAFCKQAIDLTFQINLLINLYMDSETVLGPEKYVSKRIRSYSQSTSILTGRIREIHALLCNSTTSDPVASSTSSPEPDHHPLQIRDAADWNESDQGLYDVIISDPPYGFNTDENSLRLAQIWAKSLENMIRSLNSNGGQLVLCLPERSYIGRNLDFFTGKDFVIRQILAIADKMNLDAMLPACVVPEPMSFFQPPYYWESPRALRRAILHFRFRARM